MVAKSKHEKDITKQYVTLTLSYIVLMLAN